MQCALFTWARLSQKALPGLDLLSASLNGVPLSKAQAGRAKAAGMLAGEHDVKLPVARGGYHGLIIELKAGRNRPTQAQRNYGRRMEEEGWLVAYRWDWRQACELIADYLKGRICR